MKPDFCAIASQQIGEDLIGTAGHYQTYVLIECPLPWAAKVFDSANIPLTLRQYIKAIKAERSVQFLAINRGASASSASVTLMIYERTGPSGEHFSADESIEGYRGYEFPLNDLTQVVDCLKAYWQGDFPRERRRGQPITQQDILICTHGVRDRCCARFGNPFFRAATQSVLQGELPNVRLWKVSHIGGHRFAPTAISLPDGRYYGRLTLSALQAIVTRRGSIHQLCSVYRGWGLLPAPLQILERQLMLQHGWSWFEHRVTYRILLEEASSQPDDSLALRLSQGEVSVEISVSPISVATGENLIKSNETSVQALTYRAKLTQDIQKTVWVKSSCSSAIATPAVKYTVTECVLMADPQPSWSISGFGTR
ncbi:MAG: sucrase ferredoxin [Leptolyngbya foveolarum]|uniref:Sucrase ferredoxin n=1 Tax=Leptolyngbya foveolarum TaxID=47253 RepID=A0A2W4TPS7_9CYAN|nr:MAG: sucrase ferredoxin [Leptolyngbya foveolarum]